MKHIINASALALSMVIGTASSALAATPQAFSTQAFESAASSDKPVIVGFHSPGCGSCKVQKPRMISILEKDAQFADAVGLLADFEESESFRERLNESGALTKGAINGPSTIVVFKRGKEVARTHEVKPEKILEDLKKGL